MKRFLILILFSLLFPIQNSSAAPSLEETIDFLINGDGDASWSYLFTKEDWSIDGCILTMSGRGYSGNTETQRYDLNKVIVQTIKPNNDGTGFIGKCDGDCRSDINNIKNPPMNEWWVKNKITWERNVKALTHLYSNFCKGAKSAF
tara:strand:- start:102 stop:539 length:438 start_codon:yes stop_codon:yes gene_type:complete